MTDWKTYKRQTPFQFTVPPSESYNEGNKIAFSPKIPGKSPVWSMNMSGVAITPTHTPCRYWTGEGWEYKSWLERICMGLEISYTKTTMDLSEQQILRIKDSNGDIVDVDVAVWFLTGVGSINAEIGSSITYTAPSENITESDTATIEMWCNGEVKDTLVISIPYKCTETNTSIGYTSTQMSVSQQQTLQLLGSSECESQCLWSVDYGTLSSSSGVEVTYTSPSTNADCSNNATVTITCNGSVVYTLQIAINQSSSGSAAYAYYGPCLEFCAQAVPNPWYDASYKFYKTTYKCDNTVISNELLNIRAISGGVWRSCPEILDALNTSCAATYGLTCCAAYEANRIATAPEGPGYVDLRTELMKSQGCCPAGLL